MFLKHVVVPRRILSVGLVLKDDNLSSITGNFFSGWVNFMAPQKNRYFTVRLTVRWVSSVSPLGQDCKQM